MLLNKTCKQAKNIFYRIINNDSRAQTLKNNPQYGLVIFLPQNRYN